MKRVLLFWISLIGIGAADDAVKIPTQQTVQLGVEVPLWAFQPPRLHALPVVSATHWPKRALDYFVLAAQDKRKLRPVRAATKAEWIRRATFDLIGLPPTPGECEAFERDTGSDGFAKVIDRLLESPHYGERWGRYWLDIARYADDQGNSFLTPTPSAYLYRDWVVEALNQDMPYDEFVRLQIAGDEVPGPAVDYVKRLAGLGFQGLGPQFRKGAAGEAKAKADELEDRVDTLTRGILGLTVSCARCHDHKFDPIPTRDYYSLAAAYNGAEWSSRMLAAPEIVETHKKWGEQVEQKKAALTAWSEAQARQLGRMALSKTDIYALAAVKVLVLRHQKVPVDITALAKQEDLEVYFLKRWVEILDKPGDEPILRPLRESAKKSNGSGITITSHELRLQGESLKNLAMAALAALTVSEEVPSGPSKKAPALPPDHDKLLKTLWKDPKGPFFVSESDRAGLLDEIQKQHFARLQSDLDALSKTPPPSGPLMPSLQGGGQAMKVFVRGNPEKLGEEAPPGFLRVLNQTGDSSNGRPFTRLNLANALVSRENPLTARVLVNRVWHHHFGRGIVPTLSNFGRLGAPPTHPELLDTLAVQFMEHGWSIKWLHREIMLSATYQLSSVQDASNIASDPGNEYLWRMTPRRLDFEAWRDALLSVAGRLDAQVGGPSIDQTTPGIKEVPGFNFFTRLNGFEADNPEGRRRTLYTVISRYYPNPTLTLFDFPEPNVTSDQRNATTIPQQQLFVLNSPFIMELSRGFAKRLEAGAANVEARLQLGWKLAYGRPPTMNELSLALEFIEAPSSSSAGDRLNRWEQLAHALLASNELLFLP